MAPVGEDGPTRGRYRIEELVAGVAAESFEREVECGAPEGREAW